MSNDKNIKGKKIIKRAFLIIIICLVVLGGVFAVLKLVSDSLSSGKSIVQKDEVYPTITPYAPKFDEDVTKVDDYMQYNTNVMYKYPDGNVYAVTDIPDALTDGGIAFFGNYFDLLKKGNYKNYPDLFTDTYKKNPVGFEKDVKRVFPPQKVYDITVEQLLVTEGDGKDYTYEKSDCEFGIYRVSYKILRNDGYFRPDLYDDEIVRPIIFELVTFNEGENKGKTFIKNLYTQSSVS